MRMNEIEISIFASIFYLVAFNECYCLDFICMQIYVQIYAREPESNANVIHISSAAIQWQFDI